MDFWYVTDMDRSNISKHKSYENAKKRARERVGFLDIKRNKAGFYEIIDHNRGQTVYIIKEGTKYTGFDDLWNRR